jgi:hypothetical protein
MSDEKLYEIPLEKQREFVLKLRSEIFPEANDPRYWEVLFKQTKGPGLHFTLYK